MAAIIASSTNCGLFPTISRAHSRKPAESMGNAANEASTIVSHASISRALAVSFLRGSSQQACSSPMVTAERKICSARSFFIHGTTARCGFDLRSSETTLVTSRYRVTSGLIC